MQYKALALDLDGTLTNSEKIITPRTKAALLAAAEKGVGTVLASVHPTVGIQPPAKQLGRAQRTYVTAHNDHNGVAEAVEKFILNTQEDTL